MQIIAALASGVKGAESGTAYLYAYGTSTPASYYGGYGGTDQNTSGEVELDSNGGATIYVNQVVDITVRDYQGEIVRSWTDGGSTPNVEYQGQSFTGRDYITSQSGASKPVTLQTVLNRWKDSAGTIDWKVLVNGTAMNLEDAIGGSTGLVYNVKSPTYNAQGDGTTDDAASITAAIADCEVTGGIVFFPPGDYYILSTLTVTPNVNIWGSGSNGDGLCRILMDSSTGNIIEWEGGDPTPTYKTVIKNIALAHVQTNAQAMIAGSATKYVNGILDNVYLDGTYCSGALVAPGDGKISISNSMFYLAGSGEGSTQAVSQISSDGRCDMDACTIIVEPASIQLENVVVIQVGTINNCTFDNTDVNASSDYSCIELYSNTANVKVTGCHFIGAPEYTQVRAFLLGTIDDETMFIEENNTFTSTMESGKYTLSMADGTTAFNVRLGSRERYALGVEIVAETTEYEIPVTEYGIIRFTLPDGAGVSFTADALLPVGSELRVVLSAGDSSLIGYVDDAYWCVGGTAGVWSISASEMASWIFMSAIVSDETHEQATRWTQMSDNAPIRIPLTPE